MSFFSRTDGGACPVNRPVQGASHGTTPGGPPPRGHRARRALRTRMARDPAHTARDPAPLAEANAASWHATYLLTPLQREPGQIAPKIPCHLPGSGAYLVMVTTGLRPRYRALWPKGPVGRPPEWALWHTGTDRRSRGAPWPAPDGSESGWWCLWGT